VERRGHIRRPASPAARAHDPRPSRQWCSGLQLPAFPAVREVAQSRPAMPAPNCSMRRSQGVVAQRSGDHEHPTMTWAEDSRWWAIRGPSVVSPRKLHPTGRTGGHGEKSLTQPLLHARQVGSEGANRTRSKRAGHRQHEYSLGVRGGQDGRPSGAWRRSPPGTNSSRPRPTAFERSTSAAATRRVT